MVHRHIEWKAAESDCASKGGTLVVVNNMEEQLFLMSALGSFSFHGQGVWIGLTDQLQEGKFSWVSGIYCITSRPIFKYRLPKAGLLIFKYKLSIK